MRVSFAHSKRLHRYRSFSSYTRKSLTSHLEALAVRFRRFLNSHSTLHYVSPIPFKAATSPPCLPTQSTYTRSVFTRPRLLPSSTYALISFLTPYSFSTSITWRPCHFAMIVTPSCLILLWNQCGNPLRNVKIFANPGRMSWPLWPVRIWLTIPSATVSTSSDGTKNDDPLV